MNDNISYTFFLEGKIQPYTRRTHRGKHSDAAEIYHASQNAIRVQIKSQMQLENWDMLPGQKPLFVLVYYDVPKRMHTFDLDNVVKAVLDAMQGYVFKNDLWVDYIKAVRRLSDDYRAEITIGTR